jgi:hypothetical protein
LRRIWISLDVTRRMNVRLTPRANRIAHSPGLAIKNSDLFLSVADSWPVSVAARGLSICSALFASDSVTGRCLRESHLLHFRRKNRPTG